MSVSLILVMISCVFVLGLLALIGAAVYFVLKERPSKDDSQPIVDEPTE